SSASFSFLTADFRRSKRKRAGACLFPERVRQSAQATALLSILIKGSSEFALTAGADRGFPIAKFSRSFSVASVPRRFRCYVLAQFQHARVLRHNNFKQPMTSIEPGNASAPTEPVTALLLGKSDRSPKRETIRGRVACVKRGRRV